MIDLITEIKSFKSFTFPLIRFKEFVQKHHPKDIISLDEFIKFRLEVVAEKGPVEETEGPIDGGDDDDAPPGCDDDAPPGCEDTANKKVESKVRGWFGLIS